MARVVALLLMLSLLASVSAQAGGEVGQGSEAERKIPTTLAEAHVELERILPVETLAEIDAMESERDMRRYHLGLGMRIRNDWRLWAGGPLAKHMEALGFEHPDNMSGVILSTFWCKRHGEDFRLDERAEEIRRGKEVERKLEEEAKRQIEHNQAALRGMMMGLKFEKRDVPVVPMPIRNGVSVRFMGPFRGGVFLAEYRQRPPRRGSVVSDGYYRDEASGENRGRPDMDGRVWRGLYLGSDPSLRGLGRDDNFYTVGLYLNPKDGKLRRIDVPEVDEVYAAVIAGGKAWFAGLTNGQPVLAGVGDEDRVTVPLPQTDEIPDLGMDGESLLAVYARTIYRFVDREWMTLYSGNILLPRSGLPPRRYGNRVLLREERTSGGRLWWLAMGEQPRLRLPACETGLFEPIMPYGSKVGRTRYIGPAGWEGASSYCVTDEGDLWACVGRGRYLVRRSQEGTYSFATVNGCVAFPEDPFGPAPAEGVWLSAVTAQPDNVLLLAGPRGLYRLRDNELVQELAFTRLETPNSGPPARHRLGWGPGSVLALDDGSYCLGGGSWRGVYLLSRDDSGRWTCQRATEGDRVVW